MKKIYLFFFTLLFIVPFAAFAKDGETTTQKIAPDSAECYAEKKVTVCGIVYGYYYNTKINGSPTFLDMGAAYPNSTFTVLIADSNVHKFSYDPQLLVSQDVCVTGVVTVYWDKPEMIVTEPAQIALHIYPVAAEETKQKKNKHLKKDVRANDHPLASN